MRKKKNLFMILIVGIAILLHISFQITFVNGQSMSPTLKDKQIMLVNKLEQNYQTNDIIIFKTENYGVCVKRILAENNDTVLLKDGKIYVNDILISPYTCDTTENETFHLKSGEYFVIGDNYNSSIDSRTYGCIENSSVIGKVIYW